MKTIVVNNSKKYDVIVGYGVLNGCGNRINAACGGEKVFIVSDDNVYPIYGDLLTKELESCGYEVYNFVIAHGEQSKNIENLAKILSLLAQNTFSRTDILCTLGGGVVGDLGALAAGMYNRGIKLAAIPTSLLAMVDSSVGGKTAVDLPEGKNLAGMFYQPDIVICDCSLLKTLPMEFKQDGFAEVIKYGVIASEGLFELLKEVALHNVCDDTDVLETIISKCVEIKRDIVNEDEFDTGKRQLLNFGHTIGHSIELLSDYTIPHGNAVAMGMASISIASAKLGICAFECADDVVLMLKQHGLPYTLPYKKDEIAKVSIHDKKRTGKNITIVIPEKIGTCILHKISQTEIIDYIGE